MILLHVRFQMSFAGMAVGLSSKDAKKGKLGYEWVDI